MKKILKFLLIFLFFGIISLIIKTDDIGFNFFLMVIIAMVCAIVSELLKELFK